ncbi:MAG: DNA mismatch endonuclease Vsr [Acidobacteria bacterium]|nr:DNA mismatch endonuclease Vsr [Acidobacteriota bacterium]
MTDNLTAKQRRECMAAVKAEDTSPEIAVRRLVHSLGYRYRLHDCSLPGKPDLVFPRHKKIIFVHGCFWHMHSCRQGKNAPGSNIEYWERKRTRNRERDGQQVSALIQRGWKVLIIWECWLKTPGQITAKLQQFLRPKGSRPPPD